MYEMIYTVDRRLLKVKDILIDVVCDYALSIGKYKSITKDRKIKITIAVGCFINNTLPDYCKDRKRTLITLDKNSFTGTIVNGRFVKSKVSYSFTRLVIEALEGCGYIQFSTGGRNYDWHKGKVQVTSTECSYIFSQTPLRMLYEPHKSVVVENTLTNIIILRDENKRPLTFRATSKTKLARSNTDMYNRLENTTEIKSFGKEGSYNCQIRKIYNGNFNTGGRSTMTGEGIQSLSKKERYNLTINNNDTVIYDYKSFEASIAYSIKQEVMDSDPYQLDWKDYDKQTLRDIGKMVFTTMVYADDSNEAVSAINYQISKEMNVDKLYGEGKIPSPRIPVRSIVDAMEDKHDCILDLLYSNPEHSLSHMGSLIMDYILEYFTQRGVCVLPVFDEVIAEVSQENLLKKVMSDAYINVLGFDDNCAVRKEK